MGARKARLNFGGRECSELRRAVLHRRLLSHDLSPTAGVVPVGGRRGPPDLGCHREGYAGGKGNSRQGWRPRDLMRKKRQKPMAKGDRQRVDGLGARGAWRAGGTLRLKTSKPTDLGAGLKQGCRRTVPSLHPEGDQCLLFTCGRTGAGAIGKACAAFFFKPLLGNGPLTPAIPARPVGGLCGQNGHCGIVRLRFIKWPGGAESPRRSSRICFRAFSTEGVREPSKSTGSRPWLLHRIKEDRQRPPRAVGSMWSRATMRRIYFYAAPDAGFLRLPGQGKAFIQTKTIQLILAGDCPSGEGGGSRVGSRSDKHCVAFRSRLLVGPRRTAALASGHSLEARYWAGTVARCPIVFSTASRVGR